MPKWDVYDADDHWTGETLVGWSEFFKFLFVPRPGPPLYVYPFREWVRNYRRRQLNAADQTGTDHRAEGP